MPIGRVPFEMICEIAQLDTAAMEAANVLDSRYRSPIPVDNDDDGIPEDPRKEKDELVIIRAGIERDREALQQLTRGGNTPDASLGLTIHTRRLIQQDLINDDGSLKINVGDRLVRILDLRGNPVSTFSGGRHPELYCVHIVPAQADIGGTSNARLLLFNDRKKG